MNKLNRSGFTLIELLAVITIMGILMVVAIPTVGRTIENVRRDSFLDTAKQYVKGVKTLWQSDSLMCGNYLPSEVGEGAYYVRIDTTQSTGPGSDYPTILESGGKSSWSNKNVRGYVIVISEQLESGVFVESYRIALSDGEHGILDISVDYDQLKRSHVLTSGAEIEDIENFSDGVMGVLPVTWFVNDACVEI